MKKKFMKTVMKKNRRKNLKKLKNLKNQIIKNSWEYWKKQKIRKTNGLYRDSGQTLKKENTDQKEKLRQEIKIGQELNEEEKEKLTKLIEKYEDICKYNDKRLRTTNMVKHRINLKKDAKLVSQRAYREDEENRKVI